MMTAGELYRVHRGEDTLRNPLTWTRDGSHVLAFRGGFGRAAVWSFPTKGGPPEKSGQNVRINLNPNAAVSPDGTRIAFVGGDRTSEIWVMTGLFPDAKPAAAH